MKLSLKEINKFLSELDEDIKELEQSQQKEKEITAQFEASIKRLSLLL